MRAGCTGGSVQSLLLEFRKKLDKDNAPGIRGFLAFEQEDKAASLMFDSLI